MVDESSEFMDLRVVDLCFWFCSIVTSLWFIASKIAFCNLCIWFDVLSQIHVFLGIELELALISTQYWVLDKSLFSIILVLNGNLF